MRCKKLRRDCIADIEKLRYPKILSAKVHIMRIRDLELDSNSSDKEIKKKYISLDTPLATLVSIAKLNQAKQNKILEKKSIKHILQKPIQKEKDMLFQKNIRFGSYEPAKAALILPLPTFIEKATPEKTIIDINLVVKKSLKCKRHSWVVNILKELVRAITITKYILNLRVSLTIEKLLALVLAVKKHLIKAISEDKTI